MLDLRIAHDRVGSSTDPTLKGHLRYPNNLDQSCRFSLSEALLLFNEEVKTPHNKGEYRNPN